MVRIPTSRLAAMTAAALMAGAAVPALAQVQSGAVGQPKRIDLGPVGPAQTFDATVALAGADEDGFDAAVNARYDRKSPLFHKWMSDADLAQFAPKEDDLRAVKKALAQAGLTVTAVRATDGQIEVHGNAAAMQAAFGVSMRTMSVNGQRVFASATPVRPRGALAGRVIGVSGLTGERFQPYLRFPVDGKGRRPKTVPADMPSPLDDFTNDCFSAGASKTITDGTKTIDVQPSVGYAFNGKTCAYTPVQVRAHYGLDQLPAAVDGTGQTIVIVDAYGSPTAKDDANVFFSATGLPLFDSTNFEIRYPHGKPTTTNPDWASETALDIQWAHAIAPGAKIILVVSQDNGDSLDQAVAYAIHYNLGNIISNSWGLAEADASGGYKDQFDAMAKHAAARGISLFASTGDDGDFGTPDTPAGFPASSRWVTAVGGTSLDVPSGGQVVDTGWGNYRAQIGSDGAPFVPPLVQGFYAGSGGGASSYFKQPKWQKPLPGNMRQTPDVAAIADPYTGGIYVDHDGSGSYFSSIGGTSLASPVFAGIWALANQMSGYDANAGTYTPGSTLGLASALAPAMATSGALQDVKPLTPDVQFQATVTGSDGVPTPQSGFDILQIPADPNALTVFRLRIDNGYSVLSFNTDTSLKLADGFDAITGNGVPNGPALQAFVSSLIAPPPPPPPAPPSN